MKTTLKGNTLTIEIDLAETPAPSTSGKTLLAVTTGGFVPTGLTYQGRPLKLSVTGTIKPGE